MADPAATLRIASTGAPIVDGVLLVLQSKSCPVAAYVVAQLAVEVKQWAFSLHVFSLLVTTNCVHLLPYLLGDGGDGGDDITATLAE